MHFLHQFRIFMPIYLKVNFVVSSFKIFIDLLNRRANLGLGGGVETESESENLKR